MVDSWAPYRIVALFGQGDAGFREVDLEGTLHQQHEGCSLVVRRPLGPLVTCGVDGPLYFDIFA
jgi:hypothetical protein